MSNINENLKNAQAAQQAKENKTRKICFRLSEPEYARVADELTVSGLSLSSLARKRLFGEYVASKADIAVLGELRRLGGLFKHSYTETGGIYSELTANAIREIADYIKILTERAKEA